MKCRACVELLHPSFVLSVSLALSFSLSLSLSLSFPLPPQSLPPPLRCSCLSAAGFPTDNYEETQFCDQSMEFSENTKLMYNQFIPPERLSDYLPPFISSVVINTISSRSSSSTTNSDPSVPPQAKRPCKQSLCATLGCNGTGHKSPARWDRGHITRAGCSLVQQKLHT